ncbi:MAG: M13 family metallopeptidase [Rhodoluna sp.]
MSMKPGIDAADLNPAIRPQDDLFRHVNGKWFAEVEIPEDKAIYGAFAMLADDSESAVREVLEAAAADPQPGVSQQIGDLYASFLDEERANELGAAPIATDLKLIEQVRQIDDATKLLGSYEHMGLSGLFGLWVDNDEGNPDRYIVNMSQGGLGLPDEAYYREEKHAEIRDAYVPHIAQMFTLAGWGADEALAGAHKIFHFETELAKLHWDNVASRDAEKTYNLTSRSHLDALMPTFDWNIWLNAAGFEAKVLDELNVCMPSFFEGLAKLWNNDHLEAIKLWLAWQVIRSTSSLLSDAFVNERFDFYGTKLTGAPMNRARWKRAVSLVEGSLGEAIGKIYVDKYFPADAKTRMDELVGYLIEAYRDSIKNLPWMTEETKVKALTKLDKFTPKIGFPVNWKDYSSIEIRRDDLVGNVRRVSAWGAAKELAKIGSPIDRDEWFMTPQTVNAYYNPGFNEIVFPAAILQPPFFSLSTDDAVNFGAIGGVIGHEIGHGFDDQGSKYDGDGKLESWWSDADREAFENLTGALIGQYNELSPAQLSDDHKVNGELTIGENIGDLGGLGIAYKAYEMMLGDREDVVIDGLTGRQRLFLSWAQAWRTKGRDEMVIQRLATDPHSPPEFRCNQIVRNIDAFYEAFDVQPGDKLWLDPEHRVKIW